MVTEICLGEHQNCDWLIFDSKDTDEEVEEFLSYSISAITKLP